MSAALEARYRAALRWYPRSWRAANADAIVGTMLDQADADKRSAPLPGELRDLAASGISARFERVAPRVVRDRVAAFALAIGTAYAVIMLVASEWAPFAETGPLTGWMFPDDGPIYREYSTHGFGPFASVMVLVYALWITAFVLALLRLSKSAIAVLLLTIPLLGWIRTLRFDDIGVEQPTTAALIIVALLAVLASVGRPARAGRVPLLAITGAAIVVVTALLFVNGHPPIYEGRLSAAVGTFSVLNAPGYAVMLVAAGVALAITRRRAWSAAAFVAAAPWLALAPLYLLLWGVLTFAISAGLAALALIAAVVVWNRRTATGLSSRSS